MTDQIPNNPSQTYQRRWLRRLWGAIPLMALILLVGIVVVLQSWITSQGKILKQEKAQGLKKIQVPTNVVVLELRPGVIQERINLPGVVLPWVSLQVVAEVRGKIVHKHVAEGEQVQKGTVLAEIDKRDYQNAFSSAQATYKAAKAAYDRIDSLYKGKVSTASQMDDATARMQTAKAAMEIAALNLERCDIRSPLAGVVDQLHIEEGQFMNDGDPVANVLQMDRVKIQVNIPESDVDAVRKVRKVKVTIDALNRKTFAGTTHHLAKSADSLARSYRMQIAVDNKEDEILPDMFARVEIVKQQVNDGLAVPLYALVLNKATQTVFVVDSEKARRVPVQTGIQEGWQVQIVDGLHAGAKVIVVGQRDVSDGDPVKVLRSVLAMEELNQ